MQFTRLFKSNVAIALLLPFATTLGFVISGQAVTPYTNSCVSDV